MLSNVFFLKVYPHPPRDANNVAPYTFVTLFPGKVDTPTQILPMTSESADDTAIVTVIESCSSTAVFSGDGRREKTCDGSRSNDDIGRAQATIQLHVQHKSTDRCRDGGLPSEETARG